MDKEKIKKVIEEFEQLQARIIHPDGTFDKAGRWYPDDNEWSSCCDSIRSPSRSYPYSYMVHCRTLPHIMNKYGLSEEEKKEIKKAMNQKRKEEKEQELKRITKVYKIVAVVNNSYRSVFDDSSWKLNIKRNGRKYYVYKTLEAAKERMTNNNFPDSSVNIDAEKTILECNAYGKVKSAHYGNEKYYCINVKPIKRVL